MDIFTTTLLISIFIFSFSTSITPGPNNIMLLSSGLTFGYKKTIPHMLGVILGFPFMTVCIGLGLSQFFKIYPYSFVVLKIIGILYLLLLAWKIANLHPELKKDNTSSQPLKFLPIVLFQWVNIKNWIKIITAMSVYITSVEYVFEQTMIIAIIFLTTVTISANFWTMGGVILQKLIKSHIGIRRFNITMAVLLVASIIPSIFN